MGILSPKCRDFCPPLLLSSSLLLFCAVSQYNGNFLHCIVYVNMCRPQLWYFILAMWSTMGTRMDAYTYMDTPTYLHTSYTHVCVQCNIYTYGKYPLDTPNLANNIFTSRELLLEHLNVLWSSRKLLRHNSCCHWRNIANVNGKESSNLSFSKALFIADAGFCFCVFSARFGNTKQMCPVCDFDTYAFQFLIVLTKHVDVRWERTLDYKQYFFFSLPVCPCMFGVTSYV